LTLGKGGFHAEGRQRKDFERRAPGKGKVNENVIRVITILPLELWFHNWGGNAGDYSVFRIGQVGKRGGSQQKNLRRESNQSYSKT